MARPLTLAAAIVAALLAVSGAGSAGTRQTPKPGGTLVFAQPQPEPACLNALVEQCRIGTAAISVFRIWNRVLEAPFAVGPDFAWHPQLASGVTFTTKAPFVLTYKIRPEARWSDGVPVTSRDFVFTHRAILVGGEPDLKELEQQVRSIRVVDAKTIRVVLRSRMAAWRGLFGPILPAHALSARGFPDVWRDSIDDPRTGRAIGTGPFLVGRWERGRQLTLVRNPRYWRAPRALLDRIVIRFGVDPGELAGDFRAGRVDVVAGGFAPAFARSLREESDAKVSSAPAAGWEHLDLRLGPGGNPLLRNKLVRQAIAFGVDRVAIAQQLSRETGLRFTLLDSDVLLTQSRYYHPNWSRYRYLPTIARQLLERAGCRLGDDGIYSCAGKRLSLRFFTHVSPGSARPHVLELIGAQLRRVGVEVVPQFASQAAIFGPGGVLERGDFDGDMFAWIINAPDAGSKVVFGCGAPQNYGGYCQRLVTAQLDQAERMLASDRQALALNKADKVMAADVPVLPLFVHPAWMASAPGVRGMYVSPTADALAGAEKWWLDR